MYRQRRALHVARGYRAAAALIPEPSGNTLTRGCVGVMWFRLRVRGVPVHVMHAQTGSNAIMSAYALLRAIGDLTARINRRTASHELFSAVPDPVKFNPGVIRGGDWGSSTPSWCEVDCRIGLLPGTTLEAARRELCGAIAEAARGDAFLANNPPEVIWNGFQAEPYGCRRGATRSRCWPRRITRCSARRSRRASRPA